MFDKTETESRIFNDQTGRAPVHVDMMRQDEFFGYSEYQSI